MSGRDSSAVLNLQVGDIRGSSHMALSSKECGICCIVYTLQRPLCLLDHSVVLRLKPQLELSLFEPQYNKKVFFVGGRLSSPCNFRDMVLFFGVHTSKEQMIKYECQAHVLPECIIVCCFIK